MIARRAGAQLELVRVHVHDSQDDDLATLTPFRYEGIEREARRRERAAKEEEWLYLGEQALRGAVEFGALPEQIVAVSSYSAWGAASVVGESTLSDSARTRMPRLPFCTLTWPAEYASAVGTMKT